MIQELLLLGVLFGLLVWESNPQVSPDGAYYLDPLRARRRPYVLRFVQSSLIRFLGVPRWTLVSRSAIALTCLLVWNVHGAGSAALWLGLASTRTNLWLPVLTDQVGILVLTLAWITGPTPLGIVIGILGGALISEKVSLFAGLLVSPWCLLGLSLPLALYWRLGTPPGKGDPAWLQNPLPHLRQGLRDLTPQNLLLPWGLALVGIPFISPLLIVVAYAQCAIGLDRARLYQWIGPVVCAAAGVWIPGELWPLVLILHLSNPWRTVI